MNDFRSSGATLAGHALRAIDGVSAAIATSATGYSSAVDELSRRLKSSRSIESLDPELSKFLMADDALSADLVIVRAELAENPRNDKLAMAAAKLHEAREKILKSTAELKHRRQTMLEERNAYLERANVIAFLHVVKKGCIGLLQSCLAMLRRYVPEESQPEIMLWYEKQTSELHTMLRAAADTMSKRGVPTGGFGGEGTGPVTGASSAPSGAPGDGASRD